MKDGFAPGKGHLVDPHVRQRLLDVFEVQEESEEKLVAQHCLARYHKRKREFHVVVEGHCINRYQSFSNKDKAIRAENTYRTSVFSLPSPF